MLGRLTANFTFSTDCITGPAKVIDGDTIVVADQLVRLHGIDAPELDQTFWWRGQQLVCGTMSLATSRVPLDDLLGDPARTVSGRPPRAARDRGTTPSTASPPSSAPLQDKREQGVSNL
jgi:endonuclease YncB( thermonuclease family)